MTKVKCDTVRGLNKCKHIGADGICTEDEIEMGWEIVAGCVIYYCMTEEE